MVLREAILMLIVIFAAGSSPATIHAVPPAAVSVAPASFAGFPRRHHKKKDGKKTKKSKAAKVESLPKQ